MEARLFLATLAVGIASLATTLNIEIPLPEILIYDFLIGIILYVYCSVGIIQNLKFINKFISSLTIPEFCLSFVKAKIVYFPSEIIRPSNTEDALRSIDDLFALQSYIILLFSASQFRYLELLEDALNSWKTPSYKKQLESRRNSAMMGIANGYFFYVKKKEELKKNEYVKRLDIQVNKVLIAPYTTARDFKPILEYYEQLPNDLYWSYILNYVQFL